MRPRRSVTVTFLVVFLLVLTALPALADGDQSLGAPSISIASGTGVAVGGVGLADTGTGTIHFDIPAGATVQQVLLYWEGQYTAGNSDDTVIVDGHLLSGQLVGTSYFGKFAGSSYEKVWSDTYRIDITGLKAWGASNSVTVSGLSFDYMTNGAGVLAIYDDGSDAATIDVRDGNDGAFRDFPESERNSTVPQTFTFPASPEPRIADLAMFVSSANDQWDDDVYRPNVVAVSGGVAQTFYNVFSDSAGNHWDSVILHVSIPPGATSMTVEVKSEDGIGIGYLPSSLFWIGAGLMVPPPPPPPGGCTLTQGYWKTHYEGRKYDPTWAMVGGPGAAFFDTGDSYIDVLWTAPKQGNAFYILAHQYIAAELNTLGGASSPTIVDTAMVQAQMLLDTWDTQKLIPKDSPDRALAIRLAWILDRYNKGEIGPGHCDS